MDADFKSIEPESKRVYIGYFFVVRFFRKFWRFFLW